MAKTKAVKSTAKTKATKGDASKPISDVSASTNSDDAKPYALKVPLPKITLQEAQTVAVEMLRDHYVETVKFYMKESEKGESADEKQVKGAEEILQAMEKVISWYDQSPMWLEDLHSGQLPKNKLIQDAQNA
jgi:hypothetical protein